MVFPDGIVNIGFADRLNISILQVKNIGNLVAANLWHHGFEIDDFINYPVWFFVIFKAFNYFRFVVSSVIFLYLKQANKK